MQTCQSDFARALRDLDLAVPYGVTSYNSDAPRERFAVYRNNVVVGLVSALEARFPATRKIVGGDFFKGAAKLFAATQPPRSPLMMFYGDAFPAFLADFEPAREVPYLADVARLEAVRTRAYHAADANPLTRAALSGSLPEAMAGMRFILHPSVEIVASDYPIVAIWAMNSGEIDVAPITDWRGEDALVSRPGFNVEVHSLPPGAKTFLQNLAAGNPLGEAAAAALAANASFDLAANLAALFAGLAIEITNPPDEDALP
ncbi:MAG TPA: putative DNA-binding domain-containing protein [Methylocella sp.]|nr:putative DNA-binding domain-containing protein [Methylocella sp.]